MVRQLDKTSLSEWAGVKLTTIGESCRALLKVSLRNLVDWVVEQMEIARKIGVNSKRRMDRVYRRLGLD